jgi:hypothetical protein
MGLYRMSKYSGCFLVNRNTLGPYIIDRCHRMSENSGVGFHKFYIYYDNIFILISVLTDDLYSTYYLGLTVLI